MRCFWLRRLSVCNQLHTTSDRHRHQEWLQFLRVIDQVTPAGNLHFIADNSATHKHTKVQRWWKRHPRFHVHFTPSGGELQQFEMWSQTYRWRDAIDSFALESWSPTPQSSSGTCGSTVPGHERGNPPRNRYRYNARDLRMRGQMGEA